MSILRCNLNIVARARDNAILRVFYYFEYIIEDSDCRFQLLINGVYCGPLNLMVEYTSTYKWSVVYSNRDSWFLGHYMPVNQDSYVIEFKFQISESPVYIRNVNIILEVIDGLSAESK